MGHPRSLFSLPALALVSSLAFVVAPALAGPNAGGFLLFHTNDALSYTWDDIEDYSYFTVPECGYGHCNEIDECIGFVSNIDPTSDRSGNVPTVFWLLAVFPPESCPRLRAASFGLDWDMAYTPTFIGWGNCAAGELAEDGWPEEPNAGTSIWFSSTETRQVVPLYWFAAFSYYGSTQISVSSRSGASAPEFADDSVPSIIDLVPREYRGVFGLGGGQGTNPLWSNTPVLEDSWGGIKRRFADRAARNE